jgi:predicted transposase YbfD/YdcC
MLEEKRRILHEQVIMSKGFDSLSREEKETKRKSKRLKPSVDAQSVQQQWLSQFSKLNDPRGRQGCEHAFLSIVLIAILATIGGAGGWEDIEVYAESHQAWLETFLDLKNGVPKADTYRRVFERINPDELQEGFLGWVKQIVEATGAQVIPIDGKTLKGSYDRNKKQSSLHLVSAWATENRLMLGQVKVESKSNEIKAIPALLNLLEITGCIITIDAMGTQTAISQQIIARGADYVLCLKANHPTLYNQVKTWFENAMAQGFQGIEHSYEQQVEAGDHRRENRQVFAVSLPEIGQLYQSEQWAGLKTLVMVIRVRNLGNKVTRQITFYLSSLAADAAHIGRAIRRHWGIENQLHWVLDVTFAEDNSPIRNLNGPENFSLLRRMAISLLNQETSTKRSLRQKMKRASMNTNYLLEVLAVTLPH